MIKTISLILTVLCRSEGFLLCCCHHRSSPLKTVLDDVAHLLPENRATVDMAATFRMGNRFQAAVPEQSQDAALEEVLDYKLAMVSCMSTTTDICSY